MKTKVVRSLMGRHGACLFLGGVLLALALLPFYLGGSLVLGGEGDYVLDFKIYLEKHMFAWLDAYNTGLPNMILCGIGANILALRFIERISQSPQITNFFLVFSMYFLPFWAMSLVAKRVGAKPPIAFLISFFYIVNPFSLYYLSTLNQWNSFSLTIMPLFLWITLRFYRDKLKLLYVFGLVSAIFSFAYTNPPTLAIILLSTLVSLGISCFIHEGRFLIGSIFSRYLAMLTLFCLFNLWWLYNFYLCMHSAQVVYTYKLASGWLSMTVSNSFPALVRLFSLTAIMPTVKTFDFFGYWYNSPIGYIITTLPLLWVVYFGFLDKTAKKNNLLNFVTIAALAALFLAKGNSGILGFLYIWLFKYVPFFYIFKTPVEKFGLLYMFIFTLVFLFVLVRLQTDRRRRVRIAFSLLIAYLAFCSAPLICGQFISNYKIGYGDVTRRFKDKTDYVRSRKLINEDKRDYRLLSLPGSGNYQVCLINDDGTYYGGMDPVIMNISKPFVTSYTGSENYNVFYKNITSPAYAKILSMYNIQALMVNHDMKPWYGFLEEKSMEDLDPFFLSFSVKKRLGQIDLYERSDERLPHIYTASP